MLLVAVADDLDIIKFVCLFRLRWEIRLGYCFCPRFSHISISSTRYITRDITVSLALLACIIAGHIKLSSVWHLYTVIMMQIGNIPQQKSRKVGIKYKYNKYVLARWRLMISMIKDTFCNCNWANVRWIHVEQQGYCVENNLSFANVLEAQFLVVNIYKKTCFKKS